MPASAQNDRKFASALLLGSKPENYMPEIEPVKAAAAPAPWLTLHLDALRNPAVKNASAQDLHKGYVIEDNRPKEAVNEVIYDANERHLESVTQPGVYQVLVVDGSTREMIAAYHHKLLGKSRALGSPDHASHYNPHPILPIVLIETDTKKSLDLDCLPGGKASRVLGMFQKELSADLGEAKPASGKLYRVLNLKSNSLSEPLWVEKVGNGDLGMTQVTLQHYYGCTPETVTLNPDFKGADPMEKVLGSSCRWIEVKTGQSLL